MKKEILRKPAEMIGRLIGWTIVGALASLAAVGVSILLGGLAAGICRGFMWGFTLIWN